MRYLVFAFFAVVIGFGTSACKTVGAEGDEGVVQGAPGTGGVDERKVEHIEQKVEDIKKKKDDAEKRVKELEKDVKKGP